MRLQPTDKVITYWAVFRGDKQLTAWNRNRQKTIAAFRKGSFPKGSAEVRGKKFVRRPETEATQAD